MSYEELEKSLYEVLESNAKLIQLNKKLRTYRNESGDLNEKNTNIDIEKAKVD